MRSVADDLRREQRDEIRAMTPAQRVAMCRKAAERDILYMMAGQSLSRDEAMRRIQRQRSRGRRPSRCMEE